MEVQDSIAWFDAVHGDLGGWNATQCGRGYGHVAGQRLRREQRFELSPLLVDVGAGREGSLPQDCIEVLFLFGAHARSPLGWNSPGSTPGGQLPGLPPGR